ncbi:putative N-acetyltransferase 5 [Tilletiaria anomala UBC 951]|uniref:Putative N-acetyltransferase 5 n=1 Tax=Tilletiaria anomala (strain ATCC 24038 / CBS 436.72 / UBC 951) TaxID=1037660 RepID=A0A066WHX9_TILAU|nr:putative N-acetyltransferase 5 [Tilletiaria anomala UBC 951]KDN52138.1 putative N-acetyltransferase 5 [Tilletiaria anomala UBC 951]
MSRLRPFRAKDLFQFNNVNLDNWTETYSISFYLNYISQWPDLCFTQIAASGRTMGYVMGKGEGRDDKKTRVKERHGHVTAITVAPEYRRLGLADGMMKLLEDISASVYQAYFVDLFVRPSNKTAVGMYEKLGYSVYRRVTEYYHGGGLNGKDEDGYDMRKAMPRDTKKETVRDNGRDYAISPEMTAFQPARRFELE